MDTSVQMLHALLQQSVIIQQAAPSAIPIALSPPFNRQHMAVEMADTAPAYGAEDTQQQPANRNGVFLPSGAGEESPLSLPSPMVPLDEKEKPASLTFQALDSRRQESI